MSCVRTVVFRLCCENFRFSREATIRCCVRPAVPVGILQPPPAALMHGSRGSGLALARSARQTGQIGGQPNSKSDAVARGTAIAISTVCAYYTTNQRTGAGKILQKQSGGSVKRNRRAVPAWEPEVRIRPWLVPRGTVP